MEKKRFIFCHIIFFISSCTSVLLCFMFSKNHFPTANIFSFGDTLFLVRGLWTTLQAFASNVPVCEYSMCTFILRTPVFFLVILSGTVSMMAVFPVLALYITNDGDY